ncbi:hypothetical protein SODALDRAFT_321324 [Sodiomyces alkalinus F11]|uniref:Conidiation-specific protein n=1 Tax=Sodiomyces alkalinus (strain CBS 110278 / VKM F-3762 / F11) TaxID=1314773 RepID=A0A3N2PJF4_SODAK|nr:hypothetical protein SODALDRAFT_321324 [Sodiomyces alkalinus F11]ROT34639.1 hypothetical protein SODALDRAFT_321324 [Sodiomyces alkalinus F11]
MLPIELVQVASLLVLAGVSLAQVPPGHAALFPEGLSVLNTRPRSIGLNNMQGVPFGFTQWAFGTVPQVCYNAAVDDGYCNVYDLEVYDVEYDDCAVPWTFCRCSDSPLSIEAFAGRVGRLPVAARQYARFFSSYGGNSSAFSFRNDITFFGPIEGQSVYIHELSHNLDRLYSPPDSLTSFSGTDEYANAVAADSCSPDDYAKTSYAEHYAQTSVMIAYDVTVGPIDSVRNTSCMANAFNAARKHLAPIWQFNEVGTCTSRLSEDDSPRVCMGPEAPCPGDPVRVASSDSESDPEGFRWAPVVESVDDEELERKRRAEREAGMRGYAEIA